jgi:hypothetical protein
MKSTDSLSLEEVHRSIVLCMEGTTGSTLKNPGIAELIAWNIVIAFFVNLGANWVDRKFQEILNNGEELKNRDIPELRKLNETLVDLNASQISELAQLAVKMAEQSGVEFDSVGLEKRLAGK